MSRGCGGKLNEMVTVRRRTGQVGHTVLNCAALVATQQGQRTQSHRIYVCCEPVMQDISLSLAKNIENGLWRLQNEVKAITEPSGV